MVKLTLCFSTNYALEKNGLAYGKGFIISD
jgi:hypothetical protein